MYAYMHTCIYTCIYIYIYIYRELKLSLSQYPAALTYLKKFIKAAQRLGNMSRLCAGYSSLATLFSETSHYDQALNYGMYLCNWRYAYI